MSGNGKMVFSIVILVFFALAFIVLLLTFLEDLENVKIAEQDVEKAKAEYAQAENEIDAILNEGMAKQ